MIGSLQLFDMVWILTGGGPANATTTMATFLVTEGTKRQNYGIAAAASVVLFVVALVLAVLYQLLRPAAGHRRCPAPTAGSPMSSRLTRSHVGPHPRTPRRRARRNAFGGGSPLVYAVALLVRRRHPRAGRCTPCSAASAPTGSSRSHPAGLPDPWVFSNYRLVADQPELLDLALNSTVIAAITTAIAVVFGLMAAYPLARYTFRWREPLYMVFARRPALPARPWRSSRCSSWSPGTSTSATRGGASRCRRRPSPCR